MGKEKGEEGEEEGGLGPREMLQGWGSQTWLGVGGGGGLYLLQGSPCLSRCAGLGWRGAPAHPAPHAGTQPSLRLQDKHWEATDPDWCPGL